MKRKEIFQTIINEPENRRFFAEMLEAKNEGKSLAREYVAASVAFDIPIAELIEIFDTLTDDEKTIIAGEYVGEVATSES